MAFHSMGIDVQTGLGPGITANKAPGDVNNDAPVSHGRPVPTLSYPGPTATFRSFSSADEMVGVRTGGWCGL